MAERSRAERFYGMHLEPEVVAAAGERLTDQDRDDLVTAHLGVNYSYFGAIDKTLAGFVVLDDEGDNYTLYDARGDGSIWWQDHETREVQPHFASLEDWLAYEEEVARGTDSDEARAMFASPDREPAVDSNEDGGARTPSSTTLTGRYQWLVWLLAQPMGDGDGRLLQTDRDLARSAASHLRHVWPTDEAASAALTAELPSLGSDPHLALYWLLHTSVLGWNERRHQVLEAIDASEQPELVGAFAAAFGHLEPVGEIGVVPGFRTRRALLVLNAATDPASGSAAALSGLIIDPNAAPMLMACAVADGLEGGHLTDAEVVATLDGAGDSPGVQAALAMVDLRAGMDHSPHADTFVAAVARQSEPGTLSDGEPVAEGGHGGLVPREGSVLAEPWVLAATLVQQLYTVVGDAGALAGAARFLLNHDPYRAEVLAVVARARELAERAGSATAGLPPAEVVGRYEDLGRAAAPVFRALLDRPDDGTEMLAGLTDPDLAQALALRMLYRTDALQDRPELLTWAIGAALAGPAVTELDQRDVVDLAAEAIAASGRLQAASAEKVIAALAEGRQGGAGDGHDGSTAMARVLVRALDQPAPESPDLAVDFAAEQFNKACLEALAPWAHEPTVFDSLLSLAERPARHTVIDPMWSHLFAPDEKEGARLLSRLSDAQVERAARALVANHLTHPNIHARNAAHHCLNRFALPGAEEYLIGALTEFGDRYAASTLGGGSQLDYGQTEDQVLENLVNALYGAVVRMGTPPSRAALIERLFTERRSFWWMGSTIAGIVDEEVHEQVLAELRQRQDGHAAGCYAYTLADFVGRDQLLIELLRELVGWPVPVEELPRRFFRYALHAAMAAALRLREHDLVRAAHTLAAGIAESPLEPDDHARGRGWSDPLDGELSEDLAAVLSGAIDVEGQRLRAEGIAARATGEPRREITDDSLGVLAGVTVERRLLHDGDTGEVWFVDAEGTSYAFDGYEIVPAPFTSRLLGFHQAGELLAGVGELSERALFWSDDANQFAELVRYDDRLVLTEGVNNGALQRLALVPVGREAAVEAFSRLCGQQEAAGLSRTNPWYVPGRGAVVRTFYLPEADGGYSSARHPLMVFDDQFFHDHDPVDSPAGAVAAHDDWVLTAERDGNASLVTIEWSGSNRRPQDMTVQEWITARTRNSSRDAIWHVKALPEILDYLQGAGFGEPISAFSADVGTGVAEEEIAAYEAGRRFPIPDDLRDLWRSVGHARWTGPGGVEQLRVLSPTEIPDHRPAARDLGQRCLSALALADTDPVAAALSTLDALVITGSGEPVAVLADLDPSPDGERDGRVFAEVGDEPDEIWWQRSLSWVLTTTILAPFAEIITRFPLTAQLNYGDPVNPDAVLRRFEHRSVDQVGRFAEILLDPAIGLVSTRTGNIDAPGAIHNHRYPNSDTATGKAQELVDEWLAAGYIEIAMA